MQKPTSHIALIVAVLGTIIEYYDYALYGFSNISDHFFPISLQVENRLLFVFAIFAAGHFAKPLGALVFGSLGDNKGRYAALKINMLGIAFPTFMIGLLPDYSQIGMLAPLLLLCCRFIQGFFLGGEYDGVAIYVYENSSENRRCFANSCVYLAAMLGITLASYMILISDSINLFVSSWRIPFWIGGILGIVVFFLRNFLKETPDYLQSKIVVNEKHLSLKTLLRENKKKIFTILLLCGTVGGTYHFYFVFLRGFIRDTFNLFSQNQVHYLFSSALGLYAICLPLSGWVADKVGKENVVRYSAIFLGILAVLQTYYVANQFFPIWLLFTIAITLAFLHIPINVLLINRLRVYERYRLLSLGHTLGSVLLSGTVPFIAMGLWKMTHVFQVPLYYGLCLIIILNIVCYKNFPLSVAK